ncbi:Beat-VII [Operophtera brumata]|uniref:Beat-VII n=1 Tax=Operophtera brumata TaxID=104452 RepID=A0A0L7LLG9_OPEBR|nr:Beat-VII [Operophtera brumata]
MKSFSDLKWALASETRLHQAGGTISSQLQKLTPTKVTLEKMEFWAAGQYACEIALETPLYSKSIGPFVTVRQKHRPKIKIKHKKLLSSDHLEATCSSAAAYPAPNLYWFINNVKSKAKKKEESKSKVTTALERAVMNYHLELSKEVDERLTVPHGTQAGLRQHSGMPLTLSTSSLHYPLSSLQLFPNQTVDITCLSTIPGYNTLGEGFADAQNHTVAGAT